MNVTLTAHEMIWLKELLKEKREEIRSCRREQVCSLRECIRGQLDTLRSIRHHTKLYRNTAIDRSVGYRPVIRWPDGSSIQLGAPGYLGYDPGEFRALGVNGGYAAFYRWPIKKRNAYLEKARKTFDAVVKRDALDHLRKCARETRDEARLEEIEQKVKQLKTKVRKALRR